MGLRLAKVGDGVGAGDGPLARDCLEKGRRDGWARKGSICMRKERTVRREGATATPGRKGKKEGADIRRMFLPQTTNKSGIGLASLAHSIIARVKVLPLLQFLLQQIFLVRQLAVQPENLLLFFRELLCTSVSLRNGESGMGETDAQVDLVLLVRVQRHCAGGATSCRPEDKDGERGCVGIGGRRLMPA